MSDHPATMMEGAAGIATARQLDEGWVAVATPPGSTDPSLSGLDDALLPSTVPGTAAAALEAAGRLSPERDLDAEDWWFRCRFADTPAAPGERLLLRLGGLATLATVWLNGEQVLESENMHVAHELDVTSAIRRENELVIRCAALAPHLAVRRPRPRWRTRLVSAQGLRWVRTSLFGRIPAFAPGPAPVGPWRPVTMLRQRRVAIDGLSLRTRLDDRQGVVSVTGSLRGLGGFRATTATIRVGDAESPVGIDDGREGSALEAELRVPDVALWWPHTHGDPVLYDVTLTLSDGDETVVVPAGRAGFRSLEAATEPGLALTVNGEPVFCRGGALLPDAVTVEPSTEELRETLGRLRDAGVNMIRLSGVGTYGGDELYDLCDELGLLVWQDFPFANLDYPADDEAFREAVEHEARGFLTRAGRHPSLAVLCGNSEIEQQVGMLGLDPALGRGPLFGELLPRLVDVLEVDARYVPSSPTGGELPFRPNAGVAHYFGVGAYRRPLEDARRAEVRFAGECLAFANVPDDETLEELGGDGVRLAHHPAWKRGVPRDAGTGWDFDDVRDHYLRLLYGHDPAELRSVDPEHYLALSRVVTGEVMAATFGEWRRRGSTCRGALLWTLNDVLPGAGWGILDHRGRPKAAYWYLRRALAPVAVWMTDEGTNGIAVHVANDTATMLRAELSVALVRADGATLEEGVLELELAPHGTHETSVERILGRFVDAGYAYRFGPPPHDVVLVELRDRGALRSRAVHFPCGLRAASEPVDECDLEATATSSDDGRLVARIVARSLAYAVRVDAPGYATSDDVFTVPAGRAHEVTLSPIDPDASPQGVRLRPLSSRASAQLQPA